MTIEGATAADLTATDIQLRLNGGDSAGSDGNDSIHTSDLAETVTGGAGDDHIRGGVNRDTGPDHLMGGDGDDTIEALGRTTSVYSVNGEIGRVLEANTMDGGAGNGIFALDDWERQTSPSEITDYDATEDMICIDYPQYVGGDDFDACALSIAIWEDGEGADLIYADTVVSRITGGQNLTIDNIRVASPDIDFALLGYH